jgi:hypothetical protein
MLDPATAVAAVLAIHQPLTYPSISYQVCTEDYKAWPCITARACGVPVDDHPEVP